MRAFVELESKCLHSAQHNNKPIRQLNGVASKGCDLFCFFDLVYCSHNQVEGCASELTDGVSGTPLVGAAHRPFEVSGTPLL